MNVHGRLLRRKPSTFGEVGWLPTRWVGGDEGGFEKKLREVGTLLGYLIAGGEICVTVEQLSHCSQVLGTK